jgi:hypothetical protein
MGTLNLVHSLGARSKPPRNRKFVRRNHRIIDLMGRYEDGRLPLNDYLDKISQTIGKKNTINCCYCCFLLDIFILISFLVSLMHLYK